MKNLLKKLLIALLLIQTSTVFAATANYQEEDYNIHVIYNDIVVPGDAIFVRMTIQTPKNHRKSSESEKSAVLKFYQKQKAIETASFYSTGKGKKSNTIELLCGVPVSPWLTNNEYSLKVFFTIDSEVREFNLPITFQMRDWDKETIPLDAKNTEIKTDNSPQRAAQINKLNDILYTITPENVLSLKPMVSPTESKRYTAHFGDRRIYAYSNGKSSTSLHYGNDYGIPEGSEVKACADGRVVLAEWRNSTGWSIVIEHLPGLYSLYYHLSEMKVKEGDTVKSGELIAKSGKTGLATGPHLHWEMRLNGSACRPEFFTENFTFEGIDYTNN